MVRRSFRVGLRVGLLLGLVVAAVKMIQSRRSHPEPAPDPWTPVAPEPTAPTAPARPRIVNAPAPTIDAGAESAAAAPGPARTKADDRPLDEVGEPIEEASPEATTTAPAARAGATKPAAKRTAKKTTAAAGRGSAAKKATRKQPAQQATPGPRAWVEPSGDACPPSHPLKAKLSSKIFHRPGGLNYDRTTPDRCYADEAGAEADGLRPAKR